MRLNYLKEHKKAEYSIMLVDGTLNKHLEFQKVIFLTKTVAKDFLRVKKLLWGNYETC